jgi:hypothetical protein
VVGYGGAWVFERKSGLCVESESVGVGRDSALPDDPLKACLPGGVASPLATMLISMLDSLRPLEDDDECAAIYQEVRAWTLLINRIAI